MKPYSSRQTIRAFTAFEILVIVAVLLLLVAVLLPHAGRVHRNTGSTLCISNLKQINLAFRIWEGDNNDQYPMAVSVTNGGAMELIAAGDVAGCFLVLSNELSTPRILSCPQDPVHPPARGFGPGYDRTHISYFINMDATNNSSGQMISIGDDDLIAGSLPLRSGLSELVTNATLSWSGTRHPYGGNIGFADGSVRPINQADLSRTFVETLVPTNHFAVP